MDTNLSLSCPIAIEGGIFLYKILQTDLELAWVSFCERDCMDVFSFCGLFPFPSQELFEKNMPQKFSEYHTTRIILTCNEIFVQQPSAMLA